MANFKLRSIFNSSDGDLIMIQTNFRKSYGVAIHMPVRDCIPQDAFNTNRATANNNPDAWLEEATTAPKSVVSFPDGANQLYNSSITIVYQ